MQRFHTTLSISQFASPEHLGSVSLQYIYKAHVSMTLSPLFLYLYTKGLGHTW